MQEASRSTSPRPSPAPAVADHSLTQATRRIFWIFILCHVAVWTLVPALWRQVTPMDATEAAAWGRHLAFGYPRDPWLIAWLARALTELGGTHDWPFYLASQIGIAAGFWAVWRLGRELLCPCHALLSVLMLEGVQFFSLAAIDFNDNVLLLALWPLAALAFHRAVHRQRARDWALLGLLAGLALMAKYSSVILLAAMLGMLVVDAGARASWRRPGPWIALAVMLLVVAPHILWLAQHDGMTLHYSTGRLQSHDAPWPVRHVVWPARFAGTLLATFAGGVVLLLLMAFRRGGVRRARTATLPVSTRRFLWFVGTGPAVIVTVLAAARGWWLRSLWGMPLLSLWGLVLLGSIDLQVTRRTLRRAILAAGLAMAALAGGRAISYAWPGRQSSANYPMRAITREIEQRWRERFGRPLAHVAGRRVPASYVVRYARDRPDLLIDFDLTQSPWLSLGGLERDGAVFVRRLRSGAAGETEITGELIGPLQALAARLEPAFVVSRPLARARPDQQPMRLEVAFLPPADRH